MSIIQSFGLIELIFLTSLFFISKLKIANDLNGSNQNNTSVKMHGISIIESSRLGGVLILFFFIFSNYFYKSTNEISLFSNSFYFYSIMLITLIGFFDDYFGGIHYLLKFILVSLLVITIVLLNHEYRANFTGVSFFDYFLNIYFLKIFISFFIIVGFINASNIADGANGIVSGIGLVAFIIFYILSDDIFYLLFLKLLLVFFFYNILIGRVYLGDSGSFMLGFMISTISLKLYNNYEVSAGLLACILSYPSLEVLNSISRRLISSKNPLKPDNKHLHNMFYEFLKTRNKIFNFANSITGLIILILFSIPGLLFFLIYEDPFNIIYWIIFLIQIILYFFFYNILNKKL